MRKFSQGDGSQEAQGEEEELQSDRVTGKAFPGLWRQKTPLAQKDFSTSFPTEKQFLTPLHPDTSIGNIHLRMPSQSFGKDPLRVRGDLKLQVPRPDLYNLSENQLMERYSGHPEKP